MENSGVNKTKEKAPNVNAFSNSTVENTQAENLNYLQQTIDNSFARIEFDTEGIILDLNNNFLDVMSYETKQELLGQHHSIFMQEGAKESEEYQAFWKGLAIGDVQKGEFKRVTNTGGFVWIQASYTPVFDDKGTVVRIIKIATDITVQKKNSALAQAMSNALDAEYIRIDLDAEGRIVKTNANFTRLFKQTTLETLVGKQHTSLFTDDFRDKEKEEELWTNLSSGNLQEIIFNANDAEGKSIWLRGFYAPVIEDGQVENVILIASDITEMRTISVKNQALNDIVDSSYARVEFDASGHVLDANANFSELLGYTGIDLKGIHHAAFVGEEHRVSVEYRDFWKAMLSGETQSGEFKRYTRFGAEVWIHAVYAPVKNEKGEIERVIKIATDISQQKSFVQELKKAIKSVVEEGSELVGLNLQEAKGDWLDLGQSVNALLGFVGEFKRIIREMEQGNLTERFEIKQEGDLKILGDGLNSALEGINSLLSQIVQIAILVTTSADQMKKRGTEMKNVTLEVASATQEIANGTQQQAEQTDRANQLMSGVAKVAKDVANFASEVNLAALAGRDFSKSGIKTIKDVAGNMDSIQFTATKTSETIARLTERSDEITSALN